MTPSDQPAESDVRLWLGHRVAVHALARAERF